MRAEPVGVEELTQLTDAEQWVVRALLRGLAYEEIAKLREASPRTVANQVAAAYRKSGARSRAELAARQYPVAARLACEECIGRALPGLTDRERRVVYYAALGHTNKWIAFELDTTSSTVASHLGRAIRKLGLRCRVELAELLFERARVIGAGSCGAGASRSHAANDTEPSESPK
jgi:DNA-binding NarL/FixJ family response regulator